MKLTRNVHCGPEVEFGLVMSFADLAAFNAGLHLAATFLHDDATKGLQAELQAEIDRILPACRTLREAAGEQLPPVITGPGGDYRQPWPPVEDSPRRDSRAHTRELTGKSVNQIQTGAAPIQA